MRIEKHTVRAHRKVRFQSEIVNRCGEPSCRASLTIKKMTKSHLDRKSQQKNDLLSGTMDRLLNRVSVRRGALLFKATLRPPIYCILHIVVIVGIGTRCFWGGANHIIFHLWYSRHDKILDIEHYHYGW